MKKIGYIGAVLAATAFGYLCGVSDKKAVKSTRNTKVKPKENTREVRISVPYRTSADRFCDGFEEYLRRNKEISIDNTAMLLTEIGSKGATLKADPEVEANTNIYGWRLWHEQPIVEWHGDHAEIVLKEPRYLRN